MKTTVLGSGAWGTALALLLLENGSDVTLWSYTEEESKVLRETHENPMLKGVPLPAALKLTTDMAAVKGCGLVVVASEDLAIAEKVQDLFMNQRFRVYTSDDKIGTEICAALKNIIALCAGCCDGMGYGDNTKALLMTRGLAEMARLGVALGGRKDSFTGLAGVGDLIVTCCSMHSRNRRCGILIGQGKPVDEAVKEIGAVVEGYYAANNARTLAQKAGVEMPIAQAAYEVLYEGRDVHAVVEDLMKRAKRSERDESYL